MLQSIAGGISRSLMPAGRLSILIFHRVLPEPDLLVGDIDAESFREQMRYVSGHFPVLPLPEALDRLEQGDLPRGATCITFDDGYADNHDVAMPILRELGLNATFFIATGYLEGGRMFNDTVIEAVRRAPDGPFSFPEADIDDAVELGSDADRRQLSQRILNNVKHREPQERQRLVDLLAERVGQPLPDDLMMSHEKLRGMRDAGMTLGAHTLSHPILARLDAAEAKREIEQSKAELESLIGQPVELFAYPNGKPGQDYLPEHADMARAAGFRAAVSTRWGTSDRDTDVFQLRRFTPWDQNPSRFALRMLRNARWPEEG